MPKFKVLVLREAGLSPVDKSFLKEAQEEIDVEAADEFSAYKLSQRSSTLKFLGQLRRTFINGKEYFDPRY